MMYEQLVAAIKSMNAEDAFRPRLDSSQWKALGGYLTQHHIHAGDLLIKQGDSDRQAYLLGEGTLQVYLSGVVAGGRIAILRAGSMVGEAGLFAPCARMANVEAMTGCDVWALRLTRFDELAQRSPAIALEVLRAAAAVMAQRMHANLSRRLPLA